MDDTKIIITMGDLIAIHNNIMQIHVQGDDSIILGDTIKGIRGIMQNPTVLKEPEPEKEEVTNE